MNFICSGRNENFYKLLFQKTAEASDDFFYYEEGLKLLQEILADRINYDIIILDWELYKGFSDLIYSILNSREKKIPILLVGDKEVSQNERVCNWLSENEIQYDNAFFEKMIPLFKKISANLECEDLKDLLNEEASQSEIIPLKRPNENPSIQSMENSITQFPDDFFETNRFSTSDRNLFNLFYSNQSREISLEEIGRHLNINAENEKSWRNQTYVYISRLRQTIKNSNKRKVKILRTRKGFYKLFLR